MREGIRYSDNLEYLEQITKKPVKFTNKTRGDAEMQGNVLKVLVLMEATNYNSFT
jgi:hypothetical protein